MRKKFLSAFMVGALALAATSTITSCKDYDGDISSLKEQINANADALAAAKADLQSQISSMKTALEAKDAELANAISKLNSATAENKAAIEAEVNRAKAAEAALETRIAAAEKALADLKALVDTKVDQADFDAEVQKIYAKMEAIETNLGAALTRIAALEEGLKNEETARIAAVENLQLQIDALNAYKARVEKNEADIAKILDQIKTMQDDIKANTYSIEELAGKMNTLNNTVEALVNEISVLKVLVSSQLRGIVFEPQAYYHGVEATEAFNLDYNVYALEAVNADAKDPKFDTRYASTAASTSLPVVAEYFMNPSSADLTGAKVSVVSDDEDFITRAAAAGISVKEWNTADGKLKVTLKFADPAKIKSVANDEAITVFATQVNLAKEGKDTTVTSDFAAIYKTSISDVKLAVINPNGNATDCADVTCTPAHKHPHIYATQAEAAKADPQYEVVWNSTFDLATIVETHYKDAAGKFAKFAKMADYGLDYKYELVGWFEGNNLTSETAHAALKGSVLRPQMPAFTEGNTVGKAAAYEATEQSETTIGRTPMVRISVIDKNNNDRVIEYGYVKLVIVKAAAGVTPDDDADVITMPDFGALTYNYECDVEDLSNKLTWAQIESQIYNLNGMSREDFDANFENDLDANNEFVQYELKNGVWTAMTTPIGVISPVADPGAAMTEVAEWTIEGDDLKAIYTGATVPEKLSTTFRYKSKNPQAYGDIYVTLSTGKITINKPSATGLDNSQKIAENWYATNSSEAKTGYDEVHAQTFSPEDAKEKIAETLAYNIYNVFVNNQITITGINDFTATKEFADANLTKTVKFSAENVGKKFKGIVDNTVVEYTLGISDDATALTVTHKNGVILAAPVNVAVINGDAAEFQHTDEAEAMLNYAAHDALADDVLTAIMEVSANNGCFDLPLENKTWNVRYLRPIDVASNNAEVTDAATTAQVVKLIDLVKFEDWRNVWKNNYYAYYNIQKIEVIGAASGANIAEFVLTNLNQANAETFVPLSDVTNNIELAYDPVEVASGQSNTSDYGTITYTNHGNTVDDFMIKVPVVVTYEWGKVYTTVDLKVNGTIGGNSAKPAL